MAAPRLDRLERNYIINGGFRFWQRGTTKSGSGYLADRFKNDMTPAGVLFADRVSDVPSGSINKYSLRVSPTTASTNNATHYGVIAHHVEAQMLKQSYSKDMVLSFWLKSNTAGNYYVSIRNAATTAYIIKKCVISSINTWTKFTVEIPPASTSGFTFADDISSGFIIQWCFGSGSTYNVGTESSSWQPTGGVPIIAGSDQTNLNLIGGGAANFLLADVMLHEKSTDDQVFVNAGPSFAEELDLCQRYFLKSYDLDTAPGTLNAIPGSLSFATTVASSNTAFSAQFPTPMRGTPVVTAYNPVTGSTATPQRGYTGGNNYIVSIQAAGRTGAVWLQGATVIDFYIMQYTAESEF